MKSPESLQKLNGKWPILLRQVQGHSMMPVLPPGTIVWGLRWFRDLKPGDVIIFNHEQKEKIKRIDHFEHDQLFLLGDHPEASKDSRHFGTVSEDLVIAKIIWPKVYLKV